MPGEGVLRKWRRILPGCAVIALSFTVTSFGQAASDTSARGAIFPGTPATIKIPRVTQAPKLEDFEGMVANGAAAQLQKVTNFIQNQPSDGKPATERT